MQEVVIDRPTEWPGSEALLAGLTLIFAYAAASHLRSGDVERATLCVAEAERCLEYLRSRKAAQRID